jgi:hypothetical protein
MSERNTRIRASQIINILPSDLDVTIALGTGMDGYIPSYDEATKKFTWVAQGGVNALADLTDVEFNTGTPIDKSLLVYDDGIINLELDYIEYSTNSSAQLAWISSDAITGYGLDECDLTGSPVTAHNEDTPASRAFDDSISGTDYWNGDGVPGWLKYDFGSGNEKTIARYTITAYSSAGYRAPKDFTFEGSNNNSDWDILDTQTALSWGASEKKTFNISNVTAYRYYRWNITAVESSNGILFFEAEMIEETIPNLQCYSESSITNQGSYSLKIIAQQTGSLNDYLRLIFGTGNNKDLSTYDNIKFDIRASREGTNLQMILHDSGGTTTTNNIEIGTGESNTWKTITWNISAETGLTIDDIDYIDFKIINADSANTIYLDNIYAQKINPANWKADYIISIDGTLSENSDFNIPTEKAIKTYVDIKSKHQITRGFEIVNNSSDKDHDIDIQPGTLYHNSTEVNLISIITIQLDNNAHWIDGSLYSFSGGIGFAYIYVKNDGTCRFDEHIPDYADTSGNTVGTKYYYKDGSNNYWRVIGAVRVATDDTVDYFFQNGIRFMYDIPIQKTTTTSPTVWSASLSCATEIPAISKLGIFGSFARSTVGAGQTEIRIRPNGSSWNTNAENASAYDIMGSTYPCGAGNQFQGMTDNNRAIQYYTLASSCAISVQGYIINIR